MLRLTSWIFFGLLMALLLLGSIGLDRRSWPGVVGDEATYLMQAQSLAYDFDLRYTRADYDRYVDLWGQQPEGLILLSVDGGRTLTYGKPIFYSAYIAPFIRLIPERGTSLANALLLLGAALLAARALRRQVGDAAPLWVAVFIFGSVTFAHVYWIHTDLFLMSLTAAGLSLIYLATPAHRSQAPEMFDQASSEDWGRFVARNVAAGAMLGIAALARPFYAALFLPAVLAQPKGRRQAGLLAVLAGGLAVAAVGYSVNLAAKGTWISYGGERQAYYSYTGFPEVDLSPDDWRTGVQERGASAWVTRGAWFPWGFDSRQTLWNTAYLMVGRNVGLLPYFLPLVLGLVAFRPRAGRWALLLAVGLATAAFLLVRPVNFYGGGGALANRYFLPLYPAFWFLAARPLPGFSPAIALLVAAPFLAPLWAEPTRFPFDEGGRPATVSDAARAVLPFETTQRHLKPSGREDLIHNGLWIKLLGPELIPTDDGSSFRLRPGRTAELVVGADRPLRSVSLEVEGGGDRPLQIHSGTLGETRFDPGGEATYQVLLKRPTARHAMWWPTRDFHLYRLRFSVPEEGPGTPSAKIRILADTRLRPAIGD